jgi:hypothetical protein
MTSTYLLEACSDLVAWSDQQREVRVLPLCRNTEHGGQSRDYRRVLCMVQ